MALLSPELLQKLARLRLGSRRRVPSAADGAQRSRRRGQSQEFLDHRPYVPGDDLRFAAAFAPYLGRLWSDGAGAVLAG